MTRKASMPAGRRPLRMPPQQTTFIGRTQELDEISDVLRNPACRVLTLVGPGGIGKTRLAVEIAVQVADRFDYGAVFAPLQSVQSTDLLVSAIADALDVSLSGQDSPLTQVCNYLRDKEMLLVLDNFEQLLAADGADVLSQILQRAPGARLLVTSREVLNLQEEWLCRVHGLTLPSGDQSSDAVELFVERARRLRWGFSPADEHENIVTICELVDGMPLAIELAASWVKTMQCAEIVAEIQSNLEFLATDVRNVPDRHRSMQAIFNQSWELLSPQERDVYKRLSVFRGGVRREAAEAAAGASLSTLSALVDKSLLRWDSTGRYQMHELLRQYAAERLAQSADDLREMRDRHSSYYAAFLDGKLHELTTQQRDAMLATDAELDNIRAAWQWAVSQARCQDIQRATMPLFAFCQGQSRYLEGADALAAAFDALSDLPASRERDRTLAELLTGRGWLEMRLGRLAEAGDALQRACDMYERSTLSPEPVMGADPLAALPVLYAARGEYAAAAGYGERAWQAASERNDTVNLALAGYGLTSAAIAQGKYEQALRHAKETLALTQSIGNRWFMAYVYNHLGEITQLLDDNDAARGYYQASYTIREEFDDPEGMAVALNHLGEIALREGKLGEAQGRYTQSVAIYERIGDRGGLVQALHGLGVAAHRLGQASQAQAHLQRALRVAVDAHLTPLILLVLVGVGTVLVERGSRDVGVAALTFVRRHPAGDQMTKDRVEEVLASYSVDCPAPGQTDQSQDLEELINTLTAELATSKAQTPSASPVPVANQPLIEPLSERELEVLHHIAAGLKNREIAHRLTVALSTVKSHINNIYRKLDVSNRVQAVTRARELDLL